MTKPHYNDRLKFIYYFFEEMFMSIPTSEQPKSQVPPNTVSSTQTSSLPKTVTSPAISSNNLAQRLFSSISSSPTMAPSASLDSQKEKVGKHTEPYGTITETKPLSHKEETKAHEEIDSFIEAAKLFETDKKNIQKLPKKNAQVLAEKEMRKQIILAQNKKWNFLAFEKESKQVSQMRQIGSLVNKFLQLSSQGKIDDAKCAAFIEAYEILYNSLSKEDQKQLEQSDFGAQLLKLKSSKQATLTRYEQSFLDAVHKVKLSRTAKTPEHLYLTIQDGLWATTTTKPEPENFSTLAVQAADILNSYVNPLLEGPIDTHNLRKTLNVKDAAAFISAFFEMTQETKEVLTPKDTHAFSNYFMKSTPLPEPSPEPREKPYTESEKISFSFNEILKNVWNRIDSVFKKVQSLPEKTFGGVSTINKILQFLHIRSKSIQTVEEHTHEFSTKSFDSLRSALHAVAENVQSQPLYVKYNIEKKIWETTQKVDERTPLSEVRWFLNRVCDEAKVDILNPPENGVDRMVYNYFHSAQRDLFAIENYARSKHSVFSRIVELLHTKTQQSMSDEEFEKLFGIKPLDEAQRKKDEMTANNEEFKRLFGISDIDETLSSQTRIAVKPKSSLATTQKPSSDETNRTDEGNKINETEKRSYGIRQTSLQKKESKENELPIYEGSITYTYTDPKKNSMDCILKDEGLFTKDGTLYCLHGEGTRTLSDGTTQKGTFEKGKFVRGEQFYKESDESTVVETGSFVTNLKNGYRGILEGEHCTRTISSRNGEVNYEKGRFINNKLS